MSKIKISVVVILTILLSYSCSSMKTNMRTNVKISSDLIGQNGSRRIKTEPVDLEIGDATYKFNMILDLSAKSKKYYLEVASTFKMQENNVLLLKL